MNPDREQITLPDDYRPTRESLSNSEVRATGILGQGAVLNIARELLHSRERVIQLERALREYRLKVHNLEAHNQWFERCESQWCHPSEGRLFPEDLVQGDRAALEGKVNG